MTKKKPAAKKPAADDNKRCYAVICGVSEDTFNAEYQTVGHNLDDVMFTMTKQEAIEAAKQYAEDYSAGDCSDSDVGAVVLKMETMFIARCDVSVVEKHKK